MWWVGKQVAMSVGKITLAAACVLGMIGILAPAAVGQEVKAEGKNVVIAGHELRFDARGRLLAWAPWEEAIRKEMAFYEGAPLEHGYPMFVTTTFLDGTWKPTERGDTIPATQDGMGILSWLEYYEWTGKRDAKALAIARAMGDYLVREDSTPEGGEWGGFTRSTGRRGDFPQGADGGTQSDRPYEMEPDKGGIAGYALVRLYDAMRVAAPANRRALQNKGQNAEEIYLRQALRNARLLAAHQHDGDGTHSPWPFRVDYRTGEGRGDVSGDMVFVLRLYDALIARGYTEFAGPRTALRQWILTWQIPSARGGGELFAQFFEDHDNPGNRTAWAPLNLARYLLERRDALDAHWLVDTGSLVEFVRKNFTHQEFSVTVCHEQDEDHDAWGGINSTYGAVLAMYAKASGNDALAWEARQALNFAEYAIDDGGRPRDLFKSAALGGWQEDAHTDVVHNFLEAMQVYPKWGK
jgi:hypothetical protein